MNQLKNILVPVDFSDTSSLILTQGARLASWNRATLHVLHVIDEDSLQRIERTHGKQHLARIEAQAQKLMEALLEDSDLRGVQVKKSIVTGDPADCIVEQTKKDESDLVILSAHDASKKRLGRVASQVVRHATCKVLIARDWQPGPFRRIAACVDFSDFSSEVLRQAVQVAIQDGAALEMIHVIYPVARDYDVYKLDFGTKTEAEYRAESEAWIRQKTDEITSPFRDDLKRLDFTTTTLESTSPSVAITDHVRNNEIDLVALGTTGRAKWFGLRFGSNAERLVHDTHCSVLAIKPRPPKA